MKYHILTFGCQMNVSDSERIHTMMGSCGFSHVDHMEDADLIIMNTCSVKQKAEDKVWGHITKAIAMARTNPNVRIAITGCMVRQTGVSPKYASPLSSKDGIFASSVHVDLVFRIEDLPKLPAYLSVLYGKQIGEDHSEELTSYFGVRPDYAKQFQVFVPVQTGCNKFCTYCIVPFTRKREISRPMEEILREVVELVAKGAIEVTLLGQTVNSYKHLESTRKYSDNHFVELLYRMEEIPGLRRIRYTSPHPMDMHDDLIRAHVELSKLCNHVHLPMQSGDDTILRSMNRKYTVARYLDVVDKIRAARPDIAITTDTIVGFCGETEEQFQNTVEVFRRVRFDMSFTSRYSARKGTYSDKQLIDTVTPEEKARRWHLLNEVMIEIIREINAGYEGKFLEVLVEKQLADGRLEGMSREYKRVQFEGPLTLVGKLVPVKIVGSLPFVLHGQMVGR